MVQMKMQSMRAPNHHACLHNVFIEIFDIHNTLYITDKKYSALLYCMKV